MPTYEYACKNCGKNLEVFQSFSEKPLKKHAECGGELQKVFHARGIVFKGSGFYATDGKPSASGGSDEPKTSTNGGKKAEPTKTAAPSATD
jgi:putative FmdB family regulatory protein